MADGPVFFGAEMGGEVARGREEMLLLTVRAAPDLVKSFRTIDSIQEGAFRLYRPSRQTGLAS